MPMVEIGPKIRRLLPDFVPPILGPVFRVRFWGSHPTVFGSVVTKACRVPKTLEFRTTGRRLNTLGKVPKNVSVNCIRKPAFRLSRVVGFSEHVAWPEAQGFWLSQPRAPVSFYVPLRKTTQLTAMACQTRRSWVTPVTEA